MTNFVKKVITDIYNEMKFSDRTTRVFIEYLFIATAIILFLLYKMQIITTNVPIIFLLIGWAFLAIVGFFIPKITQAFVFSSIAQIPIVFKASAKGGFVAGQKINIKARIVNLPNEDTKKRFSNSFDEFDLVYFRSVAFPIQQTEFLEGEPSCGGISLDMKTGEGRATIAFNTPDRYYFTILYKRKGNEEKMKAEMDKQRIETALTVSPAENYVQFRFFSITYGLTLLVLLVTCISLEII